MEKDNHKAKNRADLQKIFSKLLAWEKRLQFDSLSYRFQSVLAKIMEMAIF